MKMWEVTISNPVFICNDFLLYAGVERPGKYCLLYHIYLSLEEVELEDAIAFASSNSLSIDPKADAEKGGRDSAVVGDRSTTNVRSDGDGHVQTEVISNDD